MTEDTVNGGATNPQSDTELTRVRSLDVHAMGKQLDALRARHGADTPAGHRCSNLIEQLKNLDSAAGEQRRNLEKSIARAVADLSKPE
jgi:hypothetical protein